MNRAKTPDTAGAVAQKWTGTWVEVEQAQLETMLRATPAQRLAWLEEAMRLAHTSGALGTERSTPPSPSSERANAAARLDGAHDGREGATVKRGP